MKIVESKADWNSFVKDHGSVSGAFLQSWEWGQLQSELGNKVARFDSGDARAQVIEKTLPVGQKYFYIPRGPLGTSSEVENEMIALLKEELSSGIFVRIDSAHAIEGSGIGVVPVRDVQPSTTLITSLVHDEKEMMAKMHSKTRYNIRLSEKKDVEVKINDPGVFDIFIELVNETSAHHGIRSHGKSHYKAILKHFDGIGDAPRAFIASASHDGDVLAVALCIDWNGTRSYMHGASTHNKRNLMAPHLLHWKLLDDAKRAGLRSYDWLGIAPDGVSDHSLKGVTRFKKGFGGKVVSLPGTVDVVTKSLWYKVYNLVRRFR